MSTFIPQCTWTQRFFCFHKASLTTPTKRDEEFLQHAGLGLKKIKFDNKNADHNCVIRTLEKNFPGLSSQNGAIALWKCNIGGAGIRNLSRLNLGIAGYSIQCLKSQTKGGIIYITPLQSQLSITESIIAPATSRNEIIKVECTLCQKKIGLTEFSQHYQCCSDRTNRMVEDSLYGIQSSSKVLPVIFQ